AYRLKGDCAQSARFYASYLRDEPAAPNRATVETHLAAMTACAQPPQSPRAAEPIEPRPTDAPPAPTQTPPEPPPPQTPPRSPTVTATAPPSPARDRHPLRIAGLATAAAGLALAATGIYFSVRAADASNQVARLFQTGGRWDDHYQSLEQRGRDATVGS